ncbi:uncharacterized protein LOC100879602 [Megachile rotundata]|uniref:uncharacterized protein LOC100879602 n=1 Tax=Megachile rotundata TaxID=143995 RepID=UPI000258EC01|nr:PREDICTED: uncharacterized protein LOC100879602 [Megachile rotundata]
MTTTLAGQFRSNMLRRTFVVLQFCSFLIACGCTIVLRNDYISVSTATDCQRQNSTECATGTQEAGTGDQDGERVDGNVEENFGDGEGDEARGRRKKKGYGQMLMYFLGASKLTMLYVLINIVTAIAAKALVVGKAALAIATALALKKAFEHKEKVTYEVVKHPYHTVEHSHSSSIDYDHHGYGENEFGYRKRRRIHQ